MGNIEFGDVQAWIETTKLTITTIDTKLEQQIVAEVFAKLARVFPVSEWTSAATTPTLIRSIIAMLYASRFYNRQYSEDESSNGYAWRLEQIARANINALLSGELLLEGHEGLAPTTAVEFYPNDLSSSLKPTREDPSLGRASFSMGHIW